MVVSTATLLIQNTIHHLVKTVYSISYYCYCWL